MLSAWNQFLISFDRYVSRLHVQLNQKVGDRAVFGDLLRFTVDEDLHSFRFRSSGQLCPIRIRESSQDASQPPLGSSQTGY